MDSQRERRIIENLAAIEAAVNRVRAIALDSLRYATSDSAYRKALEDILYALDNA